MQRPIVASWMAASLIAALAWAGGAQAQQIFVYPQHGQSPEQQQRDRFECHQWAVQQSGVDPTAPKTAQASRRTPEAVNLTPFLRIDTKAQARRDRGRQRPDGPDSRARPGRRQADDARRTGGAQLERGDPR